MAIDVINCKRCGKLFQRVTSKKLCPECLRELEEKFNEVKGYIREHPDTTIMEVSTENDVSVEQIKQWIREERLEFTNSEGADIYCISCGEAITTGKYCYKCKDKMAHSFNELYRKETPVREKEQRKEGGAKMRYLGRE